MATQPEISDHKAARLRIMRIIHGAMCLGVIVILIVALVLRGRGGTAPPPDLPIVSYFGIVFAVIQVVLSFVLPNVQDANMRKGMARGEGPKDADLPLWGRYQIRLIIRSTLLESAAFLQAIAYIIEGQAFSIALALVLLMLLVLLRPTGDGVETWIQSQRLI
jgi:hypothetical protein